ncbi:MAG: Beta-phosphoglucomutase [Cytophagales bacterium]|jgi:HAD superfamily hydrolase (TIGR01509 family)|nr:HAD family phosphatase [Bacteroidota bacterium]MBS1979671.1 HAD family phosphatase [Bacteroidota bacterium]WHZ06924.1 MAG: Beta-phosphoglucomutase [Cytophagales bacterium]
MNSFAFVFDMDGVIVDTNPFHKIALKQFAEKYGYTLSEEELVKKIYGRTNKEWIANLFQRSMSPAELSHYGEEKEALFRAIYEKDIVEVKGLTSFLKEAFRLGITMAIGTSAPRSNVDFVLKHTGIEKFFSSILDESHVTHGKPNPEIYINCAKVLNMPTSHCIVFEDSLSGIASGKAAGCPVVGVATTHTAAELGTKVVIKDFTEMTAQEIISAYS